MSYTFRVLSRILVPSVLAVALVACGSPHGSPATSQVKVTNGRPITQDTFPSAVLLAIQTPEGQGLCTGTFVNDSQVVTAGHCVEGLDPANPLLFFAVEVNGELVAVKRALGFKRHPSYDIRVGVSKYDVSVIDFPAGSAPAVASIAKAAPKAGDPFTIVGYGDNENFINRATGAQDGSGGGTRRAGDNQIDSVGDGFISFVGLSGSVDTFPLGDTVSSGSGDSGGPLFVQGELAGVTSGGGLRLLNGALVSLSLYVDLNSPAAKAFLSGALKRPQP